MYRVDQKLYTRDQTALIRCTVNILNIVKSG